MRKRVTFLTLSLSALFLLVGGRIGYIALVKGEEMTAIGVRQWTREGKVTARRGSILDRNGDALVLSVTSYTVTANPRQVQDEESLCSLVCGILGCDRDAALGKLRNKSYASVILKRQVPRETVDLLRRMREGGGKDGKLLSALSFEEDATRRYVHGTLLSQTLGLTNIDSQGQSGLEAQYDSALAGEDGKLMTEVDARVRTLPDGKTAYVAPTEGASIRLTIDASIQSFAEKAMRECYAVNNASYVQCVVMDVNTGAILAMCMKPDYDPASPPREDAQALQELMRVTAVCDAYEPGSTFKMLTASAALDSGVTTPEDRFTCTGTIKVDGDTIRCWKNCHGAQSMAEGLQNSCNPVFVQLALRMGTDTLYKYLRAFGLGVKTGIDLPGEGAGILINSRYVKSVDLARIGFGQSVAVTPLQMITAACAVVNGGRLMRPYIVSAITSSEGEVLQSTQPKVVSRPITEETSALMRQLLEGVVEKGGGRNAYIDGYRVGGKTGTAQVYKDGKVSRDVHIGSFIGFAPADQPRFMVLVTVGEAKVPVDYGATTAAPFARQIIEETLSYLGIGKSDPDATEAPGVTVPSLRGLSVSQAKKALGNLKLRCETDGAGEIVTAQTPAAGAALREGGAVMLYTYDEEARLPEEMAAVPDVAGMTVVEASRMLRLRGFGLIVSGSGLATGQSPGAGAYAAVGTDVNVTFRLPGGGGL